MIECNEGNLEWVKKSDVYDLPIWEGDKVFFRLMEEDVPVFSLKLRYEGDKLVETVLPICARTFQGVVMRYSRKLI